MNLTGAAVNAAPVAFGKCFCETRVVSGLYDFTILLGESLGLAVQ